MIADPDFPQQEAFELVDRCHERGVAVRIAPTTMEIMTHRHELVPGQSVPLFELKPPVFEGVDFVLKRSFDVVVASASLVVLSPLLLAIARVDQAHVEGARAVPHPAGRASAASRSTASSSAPCTPTPSSARRSWRG